MVHMWLSDFSWDKLIRRIELRSLLGLLNERKSPSKSRFIHWSEIFDYYVPELFYTCYCNLCVTGVAGVLLFCFVLFSTEMKTKQKKKRMKKRRSRNSLPTTFSLQYYIKLSLSFCLSFKDD